MAGSAHELNARRARTLLRCQKVREQRKRRDALRADFDSAAAAAARSARAASEAGQAAAAERLRRAYGDLGGRVVGPSEIAALPALEEKLAREAQEGAEALAAAEAAAREAQAVAAAARDALVAETRATEKRSKLAERSRTLWRRGADVAEEMELDEQVADTWRPA